MVSLLRDLGFPTACASSPPAPKTRLATFSVYPASINIVLEVVFELKSSGLDYPVLRGAYHPVIGLAVLVRGFDTMTMREPQTQYRQSMEML